MARIDEAVRRISPVKFQMGLFEKPFGDPSLSVEGGLAGAPRGGAPGRARVAGLPRQQERGVCRSPARSRAFVVAGKAADDIGIQSGGWTIAWQAPRASIVPGTTILQGIRNAAPKSGR